MVLTVAGFSDSSKVAVIVVVMGTAVAVSTGTVETELGGVVSGTNPVSNVQTTLVARGVPDILVTPVVSVAV